MLSKIIPTLTFSLVVFLSGCATTVVDRNTSIYLSQTANTVVVPFTNNSETPEAGDRAAVMMANMMRAHGITNVNIYPIKRSCNPLQSCSKKQVSIEKLREWAAHRNIQYLVTGYVNEWRYKVGLDGEPSVGTAVTIRDVLSNQIVWTSVGSRTGHSWSGLSDTAQRLFRSMLSNVYVIR